MRNFLYIVFYWFCYFLCLLGVCYGAVSIAEFLCGGING